MRSLKPESAPRRSPPSNRTADRTLSRSGFCLDDDALVFSTASHSVKARNLRRDPHVAVTVDDERPPFAFVTRHRPGHLPATPKDFLAWTTRIARRYVGDSQADEIGQRYIETDDLLVRIHVTAIRGFTDIIG